MFWFSAIYSLSCTNQLSGFYFSVLPDFQWFGDLIQLFKSPNKAYATNMVCRGPWPLQYSTCSQGKVNRSLQILTSCSAKETSQLANHNHETRKHQDIPQLHPVFINEGHYFEIVCNCHVCINVMGSKPHFFDRNTFAEKMLVTNIFWIIFLILY